MVWISALRLRTLPLALASVLTGAAIIDHEYSGRGATFMLIIITTILLQVLSNLANDYGDSVHGTDNENRVGPLRAVQSGKITAGAMRKAVIVVALLALASGVTLLWFAFGGWSGTWLFWVFFAIGLTAIGAAITYTTGKKPYGYRGLGDLSVLMFFGFTGVLGTAYLLTGELSLSLALPALAIGLFATAVLNLNNLRDHINDAASGKITLVVRLGYEPAKNYHIALFIVAWTALLAWLIFFNANKFMWGAVVALPFHSAHLKRVKAAHAPALLDPELKRIALSVFFISAVLFIASNIVVYFTV